MDVQQRKGKFVVIEGVDGSGISTQTALLREWFAKNETLGKTYFTKEPTEGPVGGIIRLALAKRLKPLDEKVMALLFAADRMDHLYSKEEDEQKPGILDLLAKGYHVFSDRYFLSSFAYQSTQLDLAWLRQINLYCQKPDLTIFLKVPLAESAQRRLHSRIHEELYENDSSLQKISANYEKLIALLQADGHNILVLNGQRPQDEVFTDITNAVRVLLTV